MDAICVTGLTISPATPSQGPARSFEGARVLDLKGKRVTASENVLIRELHGESVLLDLDSEAYFGLDEVGTGMWEAITTAPTLGVAYDVLLEAYEVEPEQLRLDLAHFVERLAEAGLIDVRDV